jgi:hypothetical protein
MVDANLLLNSAISFEKIGDIDNEASFYSSVIDVYPETKQAKTNQFFTTLQLFCPTCPALKPNTAKRSASLNLLVFVPNTPIASL